MYTCGFRYSHRISKSAFWDALILFAAFSGVLLTTGRAGFGIDQALTGRYTTFLLVGIVGLYVRLLMAALQHQIVDRFLYGVLMALIAQGLLISVVFGWYKGQVTDGDREQAVHVLRTLSSQDDATVEKFVYPQARKVRELTLFLEQQKLSIFAAKTGHGSNFGIDDTERDR